MKLVGYPLHLLSLPSNHSEAVYDYENEWK